MENKKEMTALDVSAATDTEQPISKCTDNSISEKAGKINDLETISMTELYDTVYPSKPPLIDGLLYTGTYLFVGALKLGKSYLMAQLAYHISTGTPLWDYTVRKGTVLYLALEDDYRRLQERLYRMFGTDSTDSLQSRFWMSITRVFEREIQTYMCSLFICIWMKQHRIFTLTLYRLQQVASEV